MDNRIIKRHEKVLTTTGNSLRDRKIIQVEKRFPTEQPPAVSSPNETEPEVVSADVPKKDNNTSKKQDWSALDKARRLEQEAKDKLSKAESLSAAYASGDLEAIAKANGMGVSDYVRWVNAKAIGAETTKKQLSPEAEKMIIEKEWQEKMDAKLARLEQETTANTKLGYINKNILPHIIKDRTKFEFVCDKGEDDVASEIYDFMNSHYQETGGANGGEELNPLELLETYEESLFNQWQEEEKVREAKRSKLTKLQKKDNLPPTENTTINSVGETTAKRVGASTGFNKSQVSHEDKLADALSNEDVLAQTAPSNLGSGPNQETITSKIKKATFTTGGVTPETSRFHPKNRLSRMIEERYGKENQ